MKLLFYLDKLKKDHHCNQEQMNYTVYDVSKEGMKVVLEDVMTPPFLSDEKMVVIKKADFLTTKKIKKDKNKCSKMQIAKNCNNKCNNLTTQSAHINVQIFFILSNRC